MNFFAADCAGFEGDCYKEKIEKISFAPDGHVQFQTYSMRTTKRKEKNKAGRYEFVDVVEKVINPQLRAPLGNQAIGIMNQILKIIVF